ncbi:MAG: tyrosine-protein phosphatase, partial [Firmicutes bacterium]|nr:tyrosine-protein phosphatase [Bacillota bacterium]
MNDLPNLVNFRDFENYPCGEGNVLRGGVFARSDNPCSVTPEEIEFLRKRGFTTVIDLRRDNELREVPNLLATEAGFTYHHVILNDEMYKEYGPLDTPEHIAEAYYSKLVVSADRIAKVFRIFANAEGGVLFHCESGKDRTGTIAALLLLLNDVPDDVIVEDYDLSSRTLTAEMK